MQKVSEASAVAAAIPSALNTDQSPEYLYPQALIAGIDEVGRGCLFGPVVAAAVILPKSALSQLTVDGVRDSKKLTSARRSKLTLNIQQVALDWKIGVASVAEIDRINIFHASLLAMKRAVNKLNVQPELCLVDGKFSIPDLVIPQQTIVKGDERSLTIAAASIIAKVWRDELILRLSKKYPVYDLAKNKGYGTRQHLMALKKYGPSPLHRTSFSPCQISAQI